MNPSMLIIFIRYCECLQVQYILTEKVLNPRSICEQFHLCSQVPLRREAPPESAVGQKISNHSHTIRTMDRKMNPKVHHRPWKQRSGQITFVQISDIHLDRQYAEVHNYYFV
jgi:hypothetical protein